MKDGSKKRLAVKMSEVEIHPVLFADLKKMTGTQWLESRSRLAECFNSLF